MHWPQPSLFQTSTCHQALAVLRGLRLNFLSLSRKWGLQVLTTYIFTPQVAPGPSTSLEEEPKKFHSLTCLIQTDSVFLTQASNSVHKTGLLGKQEKSQISRGSRKFSVPLCTPIPMGCGDHSSFLLVILTPSTHSPHDDHNWLIQAKTGGRHMGHGPRGFTGQP